MKNLLITMSGGTTSVINATLAGLIDGAQKSSCVDRIYAGFPGIVGFMNGGIIDLTNLSKGDKDILTRSPGSASIGTTRTKIFDDSEMNLLYECFNRHKIGYFVNIGGNGTIKQTRSISKSLSHLNVAAAPKTVDNDLGDSEFNDLLFTPGFSKLCQLLEA